MEPVNPPPDLDYPPKNMHPYLLLTVEVIGIQVLTLTQYQLERRRIFETLFFIGPHALGDFGFPGCCSWNSFQVKPLLHLQDHYTGMHVGIY